MKSSKIIIAFWAIGVLNNIPYVVMLAGAKSISEGGTALVFLASIMPGFFMKLSSPYWFDKVSYLNRMRMCSVLMALSFTFVATFSYLGQQQRQQHESDSSSNSNKGLGFNVLMQLLGVAFCSAQGDMGEATLLALSGRADSIITNEKMQRRYTSNNENENGNGNGNDNHKPKSVCITAFASGTGLAGPLGFAFIVIVTKVFDLSLTAALLIALAFPVCYLAVFNKYLFEFADGSGSISGSCLNEADTSIDSSNDNNYDYEDESAAFLNDVGDGDGGEHQLSSFEISSDKEQDYEDGGSTAGAISSTSTSTTGISKMSFKERLKLTISLWPYMVPLFVVYAAEYALQSGVWTAIGFPVDAEEARNSFYTNSNWAYQVGVFISRSSGAFWIAPMWVLWLMPLLQCVNLVFFYFVAVYHFWYNDLLLVVCFYVGLLGGSVYVNGYMRINKDLPLAKREFALSTVSVADSLGIVFADLSGLFIQSCLYESNGISGSVVSCPI